MKMDIVFLLTRFIALLQLAYCVRLPETDLPVVDLAKYWGYPIETHEVQTTDGYILTVHRIPHGKKNTTESTGKHERPVFFLQHALLCNSGAWMLNLPHQNLAFILADSGFDVWMGNARGNTYSKKHISLHVQSREFWDFSFDEMAKYDLPAMIDYVLNKTNQEQVYYVGHSQGTLMAFTGLSENVKMQKKFKTIFAMGPVTRIQHASTIVRVIARARVYIKWMLRLFGRYEVMASTRATKMFSRVFCKYIPGLCKAVLFWFSGYDQKNLNSTRMPVYLTHVPAGTSAKNLDHYFQLVNSKVLTKYDYGDDGNLKHYGTKSPPSYPIGKVKTPIVLIYGSHDSLVQTVDVKWTAKHLPNVIKMMEIDGYNHLDYIMAMNAPEKIYKYILNMARQPGYGSRRKLLPVETRRVK